MSVQVLGGGSGVGIASLIDGNCDLANTSRKMKESEIEQAKSNRGAEPKEIIVGYDALAIYVHKQNPLDSISIEELADDLRRRRQDHEMVATRRAGAEACRTRQDHPRQAGRAVPAPTPTSARSCWARARTMKLGSIDQSGSKDVVTLVARTPSAIGYSGMGYATPEVKMLKVSKRRGEPGVAPTVENARNGAYPITRPLQIYVIGEPAGAVKEYLDWILSPAGPESRARPGLRAR